MYIEVRVDKTHWLDFEGLGHRESLPLVACCKGFVFSLLKYLRPISPLDLFGFGFQLLVLDTSIPQIQRALKYSGAFSPGLVFKHCNVTSQSTFQAS